MATWEYYPLVVQGAMYKVKKDHLRFTFHEQCRRISMSSLYVPDTITQVGNKSYDLVDSETSNDMSSLRTN